MEKDDTQQILVKEIGKISAELGHCGVRKKLITCQDHDSLAISHLQIKDAKPHYHQKTTEFYYVLDGEGELICDCNRISLKKGVLVKIGPGVVHQAISSRNLEVLIIMTPPFSEIDDIIHCD